MNINRLMMSLVCFVILSGGSLHLQASPAQQDVAVCNNLSLGTAETPFPKVGQLPYLKGLSVTINGNDTTMAYNSKGFFDDLDRRKLGVQSIIFTFPIFMDGVSGTRFIEDDMTPSDDNIRIFIQEARKHCISVWIKPLIDESNFNGRWRGTIEPGGDLSDLKSLDAWFSNYYAVLDKYAQLAQQEQALGLVIGTELISLDKPVQKYTLRWNVIIQLLRAHYQGNLGYGMNWNPQTVPGFAPNLDTLMVDAFFDLNGLGDHATSDEIYQAWQQWSSTIDQFKAESGVPVMFAEVGVTPRVGSYIHPWISNSGAEADYDAQSNYYTATCRFAYEVGLSGTYWWAVSFYDWMQPQYGRLTFSVYDVPAEQALRTCYAAS